MGCPCRVRLLSVFPLVLVLALAVAGLSASDAQGRPRARGPAPKAVNESCVGCCRDSPDDDDFSPRACAGYPALLDCKVSKKTLWQLTDQEARKNRASNPACPRAKRDELCRKACRNF